MKRAGRSAGLGTPGRPLAARAAALVSVALLLGSCRPIDPLDSLGPTTPARRFGQKTDYLRFEGVSRPVIATRIDEETTLAVGDLPPSKLLFSATAPGKLAAGLPESIPCEVHVAGLGREEEPLACLDVRVGGGAWVSAEASLPTLHGGRLVLDCEREEGHPWVFWASPIAAPHHSVRPAPLIVVLSVDTLRADAVSGFGGPEDLTPHLRRLGDEGVRFSNVASEGTWTVTSHYALFYSRLYGFPTDQKPLVSLAQSLADRGFVTVGLTGGGFMGAMWKFELGFDYYEEYATGLDDVRTVLEDGLAWIDKLPNSPLFLYLHTYAVHEAPPEEKAFHEEHGAFVQFEPTEAQNRSMRAFYEGLVRDADAAIGAFAEELRTLRQRRPVLFVVLSDHGHAFGEHGQYGHGYVNGTLYDELVRVPVIAWGPGVLRGGRTVERPMGLGDIAPTLLMAVGEPPPGSMRGANLWPLWSGAFPAEGRPVEIAETPGAVSQTGSGWALRSATHKLIARSKARGGGFELYDLVADPGEQENLATSRPELAEEMGAALLGRLAELRVQGAANGFPECPYCEGRHGKTFWELSLADEAPPGAKPPRAVPEETKQRLRDLGYASPDDV